MFITKSRSASVDSSPVSISIIGAGAIITGNVESLGDIRIDGTIKGNLTCKAKILIGPEGVVEGDIHGHQADIQGTAYGKIKMSDLLYLHGKAKVEGDIDAGKLHIETTVCFNGKCHMGASLVELSPERALAVNE